MILKSRRAGRLATSKAKCILALEVQLGGQSCVGAEDAYHGWRRKCWLDTASEAVRGGGDGSLRRGGWDREGEEGNVFMMTSLFLLLVNQLRGSSLHLLHWLKTNRTHPS